MTYECFKTWRDNLGGDNWKKRKKEKERGRERRWRKREKIEKEREIHREIEYRERLR